MNVRSRLPRELPKQLADLETLALDLRWTWSHSADHIWRTLDPDGWEATRNPWLLLQQAAPERLAALAEDPTFLADLETALVARRNALTTPPSIDGLDHLERPVAYFSMEFGLGEAIPLYAGGLGVLAGDHLKTASDLGVPIVALGLLYQEGYFRQVLDSSGRQEELYPFNDPTRLPIQPVYGPDDRWLTISIDLPGRKVWLRAWSATVGRVTLYLLDTNLTENEPADRSITGKLYGDGPETRIRQELVLGIGGYRYLDALGIDPGACHLNEGHAAFAVLERTRLAMRAHGLTFAEALATTRVGNIFTTHTSVTAGFDVFSPALVSHYLPTAGAYLGELGIELPELLTLGRAPGAGADEPFRPAYLAVHASGHVNAVSALHAQTSREILSPLFPRLPFVECPITHVTNGVHVPSWDSIFADQLWTSACGAERWRGPIEGNEEAIAAVADHVLWSSRAQARATLVGQVRARLAHQVARRGANIETVDEASRVLDPDVLTLGFARRFAEYKRPNLLLRDADRLRRLLTDPRRPVQLVIAGKAHPEDQQGKELIAAWLRFIGESATTRARFVFLEDYDLTLAQELVQGVDVWINTPRRPWEACGTSGMKVLVNGGLNLSVLDGWWAEAFEPDVGWAIGTAASGTPSHQGRDEDRDAHDAHELFKIIEQSVVPTFYDRDSDGLRRAWLKMVRASLARLTPRFSANRMMREYVTNLYAPAERALMRRLEDRCAVGRAVERWAQRLTTCWAGIRFGRLASEDNGTERTFTVEVFLNDVPIDDVTVELYADAAPHEQTPRRITMQNSHQLAGTSHGYLFTAKTIADRPAADFTPRVIPISSVATWPLELPLVAWRD